MKNATQTQNILVITSTYPRHESDYAVPWMREIHRQLRDEGHEVTVMAPSYKGLKSHTLDDIKVKRFRYAPANIETLTHEEGATYKVRKAYMQFLAIPYILIGCLYAAWLAFRGNYDVIHVHWPFPHGLMGQVARFVSGKPLVLMSHGAEFSLARRKKWVIPFLRQSLRSADMCIANSSDTASKVMEMSGQPCHVLPYGTTVSAADVQAEPAAKPRVLFTGRLIERKGLEYLLQAVPMVLSQVPDADFIITGDGDQRERLESLCEELNLSDAVNFLGFVSKEELAQQYAMCNVWVNPGIIDSWGDAEGLGIGSIEAYSYFKPVVASRVGGIPDTIRDGETGYLVPQKDPNALAEAICDLLTNPEKSREFGKAGFKFAKETFSWKRIVGELEKLYATAAA
ncbi:glycosyltransferase family 4 protein [Mariniblastus fucicola]|uniref:GDP-mannose-dependent alpha-(1-6)-phosphatidylinositol monomannoside mannosyltransferase n=1 Tax=Mariniblastus fucicola TaxID=980251 RepID=A0A5B9PKV1_9BACT|nr:glycosyltransferase family 4 protein [Mariniblastus fucicola]QEG23023.1 GDP-mannose-dependent alpha-(1-6)-phosphatidylinositol monomannoside mannosyltransferase [Mariniblastus fucicola]